MHFGTTNATDFQSTPTILLADQRIVGVDWKSVAFVVPKCMVSHCACICLLDDRPKDIVDECDQRRRRSEADRDGAARIALDPELFDELSGLVEQGDVGIPEAVNRLL